MTKGCLITYQVTNVIIQAYGSTPNYTVRNVEWKWKAQVTHSHTMNDTPAKIHQLNALESICKNVFSMTKYDN